MYEEKEGVSNTFSIKVGGGLMEIPSSFSATFYRTASVKFDPRDLFYDLFRPHLLRICASFI